MCAGSYFFFVGEVFCFIFLSISWEVCAKITQHKSAYFNGIRCYNFIVYSLVPKEENNTLLVENSDSPTGISKFPKLPRNEGTDIVINIPTLYTGHKAQLYLLEGRHQVSGGRRLYLTSDSPSGPSLQLSPQMWLSCWLLLF